MTIIHPCAIRAFAAIPLVLSTAVVAAEPASAAKPNIILCMTDDQGWGDVSYNGLKAIRTPNLDAMAAASLRFDRFYSAHPSCSPTRASVMTGRHPNRGGVFWPGMPLRKQEMTIAQAVKTSGDIAADISEKSDLAAQHPEIVARMKAELETWQQSVLASNRGEDYPEKIVIKPDEESTKQPKESQPTTP